jgi:chemotaxis protein MotB
MMAFFVMLYAISQVDQQKFQLFVSGLQDVFNNPASTDGLFDGGEAIVGAASNEPEEGDAGIEGVQVLDGLPVRNTNEPPPEDVEEEQQPPQQQSELYLELEGLVAVREALSEAFEDAGFETRATFAFDSRGLIVSIATDGVLFPSGSFALSEDGAEIVRVVGPILEEFDNQVLVEGHTDDVPLSQGGYTNWNLSADRALAVLAVLAREFDIAPGRLAATGFGEYRPKVANDTPEGKAVNRRVELVIVAGSIDAAPPDANPTPDQPDTEGDSDG